MSNTILLLEGDAGRRHALRCALERRGYRVDGEAGSTAELVIAAADLDRSPGTVLVGASVDEGLAPLVKRTFPSAIVIREDQRPQRRAATSA